MKQSVSIFGRAVEREDYITGLEKVKAHISRFVELQEEITDSFKIESADTTITHAPVGNDGSEGVIYIQTTVLFSY